MVLAEFQSRTASACIWLGWKRPALVDVRGFDSAAAPSSARRRASLRHRQGRASGAVRQGFRYVAPSGRPVTDEADSAADPSAGDPAGLDRRLDLAGPAIAPAGHRPRRTRPQAVSLSRRAGARFATRPSTSAWCPLRGRCPASAGVSRRDLREPALTKTKVVAAVVQLLEKTLIRVGNAEYARSERSFGLTTLRDRPRADSRRPRAVSSSAARAASSSR